MPNPEIVTSPGDSHRLPETLPTEPNFNINPTGTEGTTYSSRKGFYPPFRLSLDPAPAVVGAIGATLLAFADSNRRRADFFRALGIGLKTFPLLALAGCASAPRELPPTESPTSIEDQERTRAIDRLKTEINALPESQIKDLIKSIVLGIYFADPPPEYVDFGNTVRIPLTRPNIQIAQSLGQYAPNGDIARGFINLRDTTIPSGRTPMYAKDAMTVQLPIIGLLSPEEKVGVFQQYILDENAMLIPMTYDKGISIYSGLSPLYSVQTVDPATAPATEREIIEQKIRFVIVKEAATLAILHTYFDQIARTMEANKLPTQFEAYDENGQPLGHQEFVSQTICEFVFQQGRSLAIPDLGANLWAVQAVDKATQDSLRYDNTWSPILDAALQYPLGNTALEKMLNAFAWAREPYAQALYHDGNLNKFP